MNILDAIHQILQIWAQLIILQFVHIFLESKSSHLFSEF